VQANSEGRSGQTLVIGSSPLVPTPVLVSPVVRVHLLVGGWHLCLLGVS